MNLFSVRTSIRPVDVAPCRDEDRYGITPPSEAEVAAAMESTSDKQAHSSAQQSQAVAGARGSEVRTGQGQTTISVAPAHNSGADTDESSCVIGCCGFSFRLSSAR